MYICMYIGLLLFMFYYALKDFTFYANIDSYIYSNRGIYDFIFWKQKELLKFRLFIQIDTGVELRMTFTFPKTRPHYGPKG